ncbi:MAG: hypothetical protein GXP43_01840 [bacterium]|nr:hypothetical protein [bacterium]
MPSNRENPWLHNLAVGLKKRLTETTPSSLAEFTTETLTTAVLGFLATRWGREKLVYYQAHPKERVKNADDFLEGIAQIRELIAGFQPLFDSLEQLKDAWRDNYYRSHQETTLVKECDSDGRNCTWVAKTETVWDWEEPHQLKALGLDHNLINAWLGAVKNLSRNLNYLYQQSGDSFDFSLPNPVSFRQETIDTQKMSQSALRLYLAIGLAFAFYEEIIQFGYKQTSGFSPIEANKRVVRRSFLKLAAGGLVSYLLAKSPIKTARENRRLLGEIHNYTNKIIQEIDIDADENFKNFFGQTPTDIRNNLVSIIAVTKAVADSGYQPPAGFWGETEDGKAWKQIKPQVERLNAEAQQALEQFEKMFAYDPATGNFVIPESITMTSQSLMATQKLLAFLKRKAFLIKNSHIITGLKAALGLSASAALIELILPASDDMLKAVGLNKSLLSE